MTISTVLSGEIGELLIHSDTTEGNDTFVNSGTGPGDALWVWGDLEHTTAIKKFGATSISLTSSRYFEYTDAFEHYIPGEVGTAVGQTRQFGVDFWIYLLSYPPSGTGSIITTTRKNSNPSIPWVDRCTLTIGESGFVRVITQDNPQMELTSSVFIPLNTWTHVYMGERSVVREVIPTAEGADWDYTFYSTLAINGSVTTKTEDITKYREVSPIEVIKMGVFVGYFDEIRVSDCFVATDFLLYDVPYPADEPPEPGLYQITGTVLEDTTLVERVVRAYNRDNGALLGSALSTSGTFIISGLVSDDITYVVALDDDDGDCYDALIIDRVIPVLTVG